MEQIATGETLGLHHKDLAEQRAEFGQVNDVAGFAHLAQAAALRRSPYC